MSTWGVVVLVLMTLMGSAETSAAQGRDLASPQAPRDAARGADDEFGDDDTPPSAPLSAEETRASERPHGAAQTSPSVIHVAAPITAVPSTPTSVVRLPPPPSPGLVPIAFHAEPARRLVITRLMATARATARDSLRFGSVEVEATSDALLCIAPCARWLEPGAYRFGVGATEVPRWRSAILQLDQPSTLRVHYIDNSVTRIVGGVLFATSLVMAGLVLFDAVDGGELVTPLVAAGVATVSLIVGLALALVGDGVDLRIRLGIEGL
jgi:hypothetical protein